MNTTLMVSIIGLQITMLALVGKIAYDVAGRFATAEKTMAVMAEQINQLRKELQDIKDFEDRFEAKVKNRGYIK